MNKNALIIFAKNPVLGKVKTRIAKITGDEKALEIYKAILKKIYIKTKDLCYDKYLFLSDNLDANLFDTGFKQVIQKGTDIGGKMFNAIDTVLAKGSDKVVLAGGDVPEISAEIINEAFEKLSDFDIVIGPAKDGGYYLIGMNEPDISLFEKMEWSNENVLKETIERIKKKGKNFYLLKELSDVDTYEDLNYEL
jgi:rSAM/selenodomain-associated transferase 1